MFHSTNNRFMRLLAFITILSSIVYSQTGSISGKILGKTGNEILTGANVIVEGTRFGATADLDGNYSIKNLPMGKYNLKFTYISYNPLRVEAVEVKSEETTKIDVALESSAQTMLEVVVTADALQNSDASLVKNQKNSLDIIDGISGDMISKTNSSDGTDVLKR
ncbi:MAG: carboxypeptidase-like regulatory domain-containing protein [Ignavibacteriales bacterium]|nr:carboxypeptidase-like regulatory domain-containing protein [Ignavibacteriales bacterium]